MGLRLFPFIPRDIIISTTRSQTHRRNRRAGVESGKPRMAEATETGENKRIPAKSVRGLSRGANEKTKRSVSCRENVGGEDQRRMIIQNIYASVTELEVGCSAALNRDTHPFREFPLPDGGTFH